jgi:hypothetical protein
VWVLLQDLREYNEHNLSMPVTTTTDATPAFPPPTTVLATRFAIAREAVECAHLVVDLALVRQVGVHARTPKFASMWLWSGSGALDAGTLASTSGSLRWSGNVTLPASLVAAQAPNTSVLQTHRFVLPTFQPALAPASAYWLGVSIAVDRAYHPTSRTFNEVRWAPASTAIPSARLGTTGVYRVTDRFGNGAALRTPVLAAWTSALVAEPALLSPPGSNTSVTHRLASMICGQCLGPVDPANPALLPQGPPAVYEAASVPASPSPSSAESPTPPWPSPPSASSVALPSPTFALGPSPSPSPTPSSTSSPSTGSSGASSSPVPTPVAMAPSPSPSPSPSPDPQPWPWQTPSVVAVGEKEKSASVTLTLENIAAIAALVIGIFAIGAVILYIVARRHIRKWAERVFVARDEQGKFTKLNEIDVDVDKLLDPAHIELDDRNGGGDSTEGDASNAEPFYRDQAPMSVVNLEDGNLKK